MTDFVKLNLETEKGNNMYFNRDYLKPYEEELLMFLDGLDYMRTYRFAKDVMKSQEIKANNVIEGIKDDLSIIEEVIRKKRSFLSNETRKRIINLYHGYQYILTNEDINKDSLKVLYAKLSDGLLDVRDILNMGSYYRNGDVFILKNNRLDADPFMGVDASKIDYFMNQYFEFINDGKMESSELDVFVKSQIMHFYFVYIHPYFDVNGRTSRTMSMWYLLNNKSYPYIIFNRAIAFAQKDYELNIIKSRSNGDLTFFLKYMLICVEKELEKEYLIRSIQDVSGISLSKEDSQILEYLLSMNGNLTVKDLATIYNNYNERKKSFELLNEKILPLIESSILINKGNTKSYIVPGILNMNIDINPNYVCVDPLKVKHLNVERFIKSR